MKGAIPASTAQTQISQYLILRAFCRMMKEGEFFEGTRCLLVDKGSKPDWRFKVAKAVPDALIKQFLE